MSVNLHSKSFLSLLNFTSLEIRYLLDLAHKLKIKRKQGSVGSLLKGKNLVLLFEKSSTRTRCAFETSIAEEGGYSTYLDIAASQFREKESVEDSARIFAGYYHGIIFRGFLEQTLVDLAKYSNIPVYNALSDNDHPTQILASLMTIEEKLPHKTLREIKVVYVGDTRNNVANAWMYGCAKMGMHFVAYGPKELHPDSKIMEKASIIGKDTGAIIEVSDDIKVLAGADVIYTDAWVSMGEESQLLARVDLLKKYQITMELLAKTNNPNVLFMHCLPAFHDLHTKFAENVFDKHGVDIREVTDEVFRSKHSVVFNEAENRLHTIKAILVATLG
jgi:ornithine carbamoyltransferase